VTLNKRTISNDIEEDVVLELASFWRLFLEDKLNDVLNAENKPVKSKDTNVVVSVTDRKERNYTKRYDDTSIDWAAIERKLVGWGKQFRASKRLRLNISFNYIEASQSTAISSVRVERRGRLSRTERMLAGRAMQLRIEEEASGRPSVWVEMYRIFRCLGHPCQLGPYC
jgi:hypothetical protein